MYLVDTNIVSAAAPSKRAHDAALVTWMDEHSAYLHLSAISIAEIAAGIAGLRCRGAMRRAGDLEAWLETLLHLYSDRVLPFDAAVARLAGGLADRAQGMGHAPGFADVAIAATAQHHGLTILTRNTRHFAPLGVPFHDPSHALPPARSTLRKQPLPGPTAGAAAAANRSVPQRTGLGTDVRGSRSGTLFAQVSWVRSKR